MLITLDIEDHAPPGKEERFAEAIAPLLDALTRRRIRATIFVVGSLAPRWADELRELRAHGHEVGLHGYTHRFVRDLGAAGLRDDLARGRDTLGEVLGTRPMGYRAPYFSLTSETPWAPDVIRDAGFGYSSSVLPAWNPQAGLVGAPRGPFRWPNGLVEFPVPVFGVGPVAVPVLGGAYLRLAPAAVVKLAARTARGDGRWTYAHPYDFDVEEPFAHCDGQSWIVARLLFMRRRLMLRRILSLADPTARSFSECAIDADFVSELPSFGLER